MVEGTGHMGLRRLCVQVLAALLHALPLKEDMEEWITMGYLFSFLNLNGRDQVPCCWSSPENVRLQCKGGQRRWQL